MGKHVRPKVGKALIVVAAVLSVMPVRAQGPGWTANGIITRLVVTSQGGVNVRLSPDVTGCTSQSGYGPNYASIYPSHPGINRIQASLLAAYHAGTPVALYLNDSTCTVMEILVGGW